MNFSFSHSRKGSALLIGMWLIIVLTIIGIVFIEKIWRFSENTENIEQSNAAYYQATAGIEKTMLTTNKKTPWNITGQTQGSILNVGYSGTELLTLTETIPRPGYGTSQYDNNWNTISLGSSVQIVLPEGLDWGTVGFYFRVPNLDYSGSTQEALSNPLAAGMVNWILAGSGEILFASGETNTFRAAEICASNSLCGFPGQLIRNKNGTTTGGEGKTFQQFWDTNLQDGGIVGRKCSPTGNDYACTLKLSLLRPLIVSPGGQIVPFLEYKLMFNKNVPDQFMHITTQGWSDGFARSRSIEVPQITTNTALDFTILQ